MSFTQLARKIKEKNNPTVMGLDPKLEYIPKQISDNTSSAGDAIYEFNKALIDACADYIPAVKPQSAFYEAYGLQGIEALIKTIKYSQSKGLYVILDAKRGDIGSTAEAYADAYLNPSGEFNADCLTVNPYLGVDGVEPFIRNCEKYDKAIFILVKTSNKSSGDFQDVTMNGGQPLYELVADKAAAWGSPDNVGMVIGATYPEQLKTIRHKLKDTFFLIPGYGAQGGSIDDVKHAFNTDGHAIINSSRAIMCAYMKENKPEKFAECALKEVLDMKEKLVRTLNL